METPQHADVNFIGFHHVERFWFANRCAGRGVIPERVGEEHRLRRLTIYYYDMIARATYVVIFLFQVHHSPAGTNGIRADAIGSTAHADHAGKRQDAAVKDEEPTVSVSKDRQGPSIAPKAATECPPCSE